MAIKLTDPTADDKKIIFDGLHDLYKKGININVYQKELIQDLDHLKIIVAHMASSPHSIHRNKTVDNYMLSLDDENIGFITMSYDFKNNDVEILYFSIIPKYQHQGLGKKYFKLALEIIEKSGKSISVVVRNKNSPEMLSILKENDFRETSLDEQGFLPFYKNMNVIYL